MGRQRVHRGLHLGLLCFFLGFHSLPLRRRLGHWSFCHDGRLRYGIDFLLHVRSRTR